MKLKYWCIFTLFLPLLLPGIIAGPEFMGPRLHTHNSLFNLQLQFGGLSYAIFLCIVLWWARDKTGSDIRRIGRRLPPVFAVFCPLFLVLADVQHALERPYC